MTSTRLSVARFCAGRLLSATLGALCQDQCAERGDIAG
jgi:hypothetical protein